MNMEEETLQSLKYMENKEGQGGGLKKGLTMDPEVKLTIGESDLKQEGFKKLQIDINKPILKPEDSFKQVMIRSKIKNDDRPIRKIQFLQKNEMIIVENWKQYNVEDEY
jgi:hypothetical protein